jgi:tRNA dimethylallyltransferase
MKQAFSAGSPTSPLVVLVGETASGKTALALELAEHFNGEIICADSWTVYKGFDIGTAKPSFEDRQRVLHHLLDIADPLQGFSAAEYKRLAEGSILDVGTRGKLPIMVGGTGLYIDGVLYDYGFLPSAGPELRDELNQLSITELLERISDAEISTEGIDVRNKRRLIRLLEVDGERPVKSELRPKTLILGLRVPREELRDRITHRVDAMLAAGLEREVRTLMDEYGWGAEPMKGIGYREFHDYFCGSQSLAQTRERIISSTLGLAKRQRTWFKRNHSIQWIDDPSKAPAIVRDFLNKTA